MKQKQKANNSTIHRWHFYMGIFVIPFMLILSLSGLAMMYIGYFDGRDGEKITIKVPDNKVVYSLELQKQKVLEKYPNAKILELIKAPAEDRVNVFRIKIDKKQEMIAVNPYTASIIKDWQRRKGWYDFADNIHSDLLLGEFGDRLLEISAGFGILLLISGFYLYFPKRSRFKNANFFKKIHIKVGVSLSAILLLFLLSGMSWTGIWGSKIVQAWSTFPEEKWDKVPLSQKNHKSLNNTNVGGIPWALEQTSLPKSVSKGNDMHNVNIDMIVKKAKKLGFQGRYRVSFPKDSEAVWTINQDTMNSDSTNPFGDKTVHIDQYSGKVLAKVYFKDYSLAGKIMALSIPLHMGLVNIWNLIINTIVCLGLIVLSISGATIWWKRRPSGLRLGSIKKTDSLSDSKSLLAIIVIVGIIFPLSGITLLIVYLFDKFVISKVLTIKNLVN